MKFAVIVLLFVLTAGAYGAQMICQYASWAVYRVPGGTFSPDMLDPTLCTHGVYLTAGLDANDQMVSLDPWADLETGGGKGGYKKFTDLKLINPSFKPILALGSWYNAANHYSAIAADPARRTTMSQSAVAFLKQYNFNGLEVDWIYPSTTSDKENFPLLLAELRRWFEPEGFQILVTTAAIVSTIEQVYDLPAMAQSADYLVMMGYDYTGAWDPYTGHTTPLYLPDNSTLCVNATVHAHLKSTVNPAQLVLGFPGFGRTWKLLDPAQHGVGALAIGPGTPGPYTWTEGVLSYNEITQFFDGYTVERDPLSQAAYGYTSDGQWVSMEDTTSATFKAEYCANLGLAGAAIWTIDYDYFVGGAFTLVRAIRDGFPAK